MLVVAPPIAAAEGEDASGSQDAGPCIHVDFWTFPPFWIDPPACGIPPFPPIPPR